MKYPVSRGYLVFLQEESLSFGLDLLFVLALQEHFFKIRPVFSLVLTSNLHLKIYGVIVVKSKNISKIFEFFKYWIFFKIYDSLDTYNSQYYKYGNFKRLS